MLGASVFGLIIGNIASLIADFNQYENIYKQRMEGVKNYLIHKKVPKEMQRRIRKACSYYFRTKGVAQEDWATLPPRLRYEVLRFEQKFFIDLFPSLSHARGGGEELLEKLVMLLRPFNVLPRAIYGCPYRLPEADFNVVYCTEVVFISKGEMSVINQPGALTTP